MKGSLNGDIQETRFDVGKPSTQTQKRPPPALAALRGEFEGFVESGFVLMCPGEDLNLHDLAVASS